MPFQTYVSKVNVARFLACLGVFAATLMIVSSYHFFGQTSDEPAHVAAGMEWIARGDYTLDPIDPPLPRVSVAFGPYLLGARPAGIKTNVWREGDQILHGGNSERLLAAARLGTLPWFLLLAFLVWRRTRLWLGYKAAVLSVWLLAFCPPLLANSSLATTDICFAAIYMLAIEALWLLLERPSLPTFALAGAAAGLGVLAKLSALPYLGMCLIAVGILFYRRYRAIPGWRLLLTFCIAAFLVIGTGYRWVAGPLASRYATSEEKIDRLVLKAGRFQSEARYAVDHFPLAPFWKGILVLAKFGRKAHPVYFLGHNHPKGVLSFYFVVFLAKTPIPLLLLGIAGIVITVQKLRKSSSGLNTYATLALITMTLPFLFATFARVNIGMRHVLVVYSFFLMFAAACGKWLWEYGGRYQVYTRGLVLLLVTWQVGATVHAFPDFLVYANEVAEPYAKSVSIDSDYDWGQDLKRLISYFDQRHVPHIWIAYNGFAESDMKLLPPWHTLPDGQQVNGWIAVSEESIRRNPEKLGWLNQYTPVNEVGHTIRVYYLDPAKVPSSLSWDQRVEPIKPEDAF